MSRPHGRLQGRARRDLTAETLHRLGTVCHLCGGAGADTLDHLLPLSLGGHPTSWANRAPAHADCNRRRGALTLAEWFARYPLPTRTPLPPSRDW